MSNAIKFTEPGEVVVGVEKGWQRDGQVAVHVVVRDTGIGTAPERREAIFSPFTQARLGAEDRVGSGARHPMHYLLLYDYVENAVERQALPGGAPAPPPRGAGAEMLMGEAFADPVGGAALLFHADDPSVVEAFVRRDPYVTRGVVTRWRIRP